MSRTSVRDRVAYSGRWALAQAADATGVLALKRRAALQGRAIVLAYHRVLPSSAPTWSHPGIIVTPETFERQMRLLTRDFRPLTLAEFEGHLATRTPFESGSCLVTFDDGWIDTYTEAWPILRRLRVPAVVFLPSSFIGSSTPFWQERLGMLVAAAAARVQREPAFDEALREALRPSGLEPLMGWLGDAKPVVVARIRGLKLNPAVSPWEAVERLDALLDRPSDPASVDRYITWDHVREMAGDGVAFGAHGHSHRILSTLTRDEVARELGLARSIIEREIAQPVTSMSYPNGGWNDTVADEVRMQGFRTAFSIQAGHASALESPYAIRRINVHEGLTDSDALFRARILGVF